jgi:hypothetical protein
MNTTTATTNTTPSLTDAHTSTLLAGYRSPAELTYGPEYTPAMVQVRMRAEELGLTVEEIENHGFEVLLGGNTILGAYSYLHALGHVVDRFLPYAEGRALGRYSALEAQLHISHVVSPRA